MKKLISIIIALAVAAFTFTFTSCSKSDPDTPEEADNTDMPSDILACAFIDCAKAAMEFYYDGTYKAADGYTDYFRWKPGKSWICTSISGSTIRLYYANYLFINSLQDYKAGNHVNGDKYPNDDIILADLHQDIPTDTRNAVVNYLKANSNVKNVSVPFAYIIDIQLK